MLPIRKLLTVAVLIALVGALPTGEITAAGDTATILGFLLLTAYLAGSAAADIGLPRVTGYILLGLLVGPGVLGVISELQVDRLKPIDDIAISLIALAAGGELRISMLRERGKEILGIMGTEMVSVFTVVFVLTLLLSGHLPFTEGRELGVILVIAMVFGSIAIANSPSVTIAVITDTRSRGPTTSTMLGVTVAKDVAVVLAFAVAISIARAQLGGAGEGAGAVTGTILWEVGGSIVTGAVGGWLISLYLRRLGAHSVLFVLAAAFLNALVAGLLHFEVLLMSLVAGFVVENLKPEKGESFVEAVEANSLPFYALFFSLAGAHIALDRLLVLLPFVALFVGSRAAAVWVGTNLGARWTGAPETVRKYAWVGFISQAGVTLGMVSIVSRAFPAWGTDLYTLFLAMVAVHELVGPVLLQWGLKRAGEIGMRDRPDPASTPDEDVGTAAARVEPEHGRS